MILPELPEKFSQKWKKENEGGSIFIPSKKDLWFDKVESRDLPDLLLIGPDYVKMVLYKSLGVPARSDIPDHVYLAWDEYRHALIRGIRKKFISPKEIKERLLKKKK